MTNRVALARLNDGSFRIRDLDTSRVLLETKDATLANAHAAEESRRRGATDGPHLINQQMDDILELDTVFPLSVDEEFSVVRIRHSEMRRLFALLGTGNSTKASLLLQEILKRDDFCLYTILTDSPKGVTSYVLIGDQLPGRLTIDTQCTVEGPQNLRTLCRTTDSQQAKTQAVTDPESRADA